MTEAACVFQYSYGPCGYTKDQHQWLSHQWQTQPALNLDDLEADELRVWVGALLAERRGWRRRALAAEAAPEPASVGGQPVRADDDWCSAVYGYGETASLCRLRESEHDSSYVHAFKRLGIGGYAEPVPTSPLAEHPIGVLARNPEEFFERLARTPAGAPLAGPVPSSEERPRDLPEGESPVDFCVCGEPIYRNWTGSSWSIWHHVNTSLPSTPPLFDHPAKPVRETAQDTSIPDPLLNQPAPEPVEGWTRMSLFPDGAQKPAIWARAGESVAVPLAVERAIEQPLKDEIARLREARDYYRSLIEQIHTDAHDALAATPDEGSLKGETR